MKVVIFMIALAGLVFGFLEGMVIGDCLYNRIINYFPTRMLGCELTKIRGEK
jgi:hypothetical protein